MCYTLTYETVYLLMILGIVIWTFLWNWSKNQKKFWNILNTLLCLGAFYLVLKYTMLYRITSDNHQFALLAPFNSEFYRELLMNAFLFYPLGLTLTVLLGPWSILVACVLSFGIECWQYIAGTGLAQGSDVLMNTLGCAIGAIPYFIRSLWGRGKNK